MQPGPALPPPVRRSAVPFVVPAAIAGIVLIAFVGDPFWVVASGCVVIGLGIAAAVADETGRRRATRAWDAVTAVAVAPRVDRGALAEVRQRDGEIAAIRSLRQTLPGCPLRRARDLVAELTGVPAGSR